MSHPDRPPIVPADGDALTGSSDGLVDDREGLFDTGERPLDPDLDDDDVNSAAADERAATEGTLDGEVDDRP